MQGITEQIGLTQRERRALERFRSQDASGQREILQFAELLVSVQTLKNTGDAEAIKAWDELKTATAAICDRQEDQTGTGGKGGGAGCPAAAPD